MVDRIQVIKWERPGGGGTENPDFPTEIEPNEDALDARGLFIQNDVTADEKVYMTREEDRLVAKDELVPLARSLYQFPHAWRTVPANQTRTISPGHDHAVTDLTLEDSGVLVLEDGGRLVLLG